jgi:hypothetical protein
VEQTELEKSAGMPAATPPVIDVALLVRSDTVVTTTSPAPASIQLD